MTRRLMLAALCTVVACTAACTAGRTTDGPNATRTAHPQAPVPTSAPHSATESAQVSTRRRRPVIVVDPGHSVTVHETDPATGLDVSDYENEPEMRDVWAVAQIVRRRLTHAGYRVVLTKRTLDAPTSLGKRAHIANRVHAALALSIHDQAGANGGIGFDSGNNTVYYQSVGTYRETPTGTKVYFTDRHVAALSKRYAAVFRRKRSAAQHTPIHVQGNTGYDLGSRGLPAGDIWMVQLLSTVPWIYNEAGGNSAGRVGLNRHDRRAYAAGLVASVEACVPIR